MDALSLGVRRVLSGRGWSLRRRRGGFLVSRRGSPPFCELAAPEASGAPRALTHADPLRARALPGARLSAEDRRGLDELGAALGLLLESLRGTRGSEAPALAEAHEGSEGRDLLVRTTFACNQRCAFCFVPLTGRAAGLPQIERELDRQAALAGPRAELTLSGGEPASDPRLPRILELAREKGFRRFVLQTNAVHLARPGLLETLSGLGVGTYLVSFHSHDEAAYDRITGSRGQYPKALAGLKRLLAARGCDVTVNVVVNAVNCGHLPELMDFLGALGRPGVYLSMLNEAGHQKAPHWAVDLERAAPFLRRAAARCRARGLEVSRCGGESSFPVCVLGDPRRHAARRSFPQDRVRYQEDFSGERVALGRAKRPACRRCRYDARCPGVPAAYAALFGLGALRWH